MNEKTKIENAKLMLQALIEENLQDMQNYLTEFLDEVEEDTHFLYNLQHCRKLRNQYFDILDMLESEEQ